jgi:sugar/nucleoside kinase (ribokinase family)
MTPEIVVVGSVAFDSIQAPAGSREKMLGGSASYAAVGAALFAPTGLVAVVGDDFPAEYVENFKRAGVDLAGFERAQGETFHWSGTYTDDMNDRVTNFTKLGVFEKFSPAVPKEYRDAPCLALGNIAPALQLEVLKQMTDPKFVMLDTMNLWIANAREDLVRAIEQSDMVVINEHEIRELTGKTSLLSGAQELLAMGPSYALVKKGEHGAFLLTDDGFLAAPAWPMDLPLDSTGAGDTFSAGIIGTIAEAQNLECGTLRRAMANATCLASFACEAFGLEKLLTVTREELDARVAKYREMLP